MGARQSRLGRIGSSASIDVATFDFRKEEMEAEKERRRDLCGCLEGGLGCRHVPTTPAELAVAGSTWRNTWRQGNSLMCEL